MVAKGVGNTKGRDPGKYWSFCLLRLGNVLSIGVVHGSALIGLVCGLSP